MGILGSIAQLVLSGMALTLEDKYATPNAFVQLALATSVLSLIGLSLVLYGEFWARKAFFARTAFELAIVGVVWVLWLASAAYTTTVFNSLLLYGMAMCDGGSVIVNLWVWTLHIPQSNAESLCKEWRGISTLTWLVFSSLLSAWMYTLVFAVVNHLRGNRDIWQKNVGSYIVDKEHSPRAKRSWFMARQWGIFKREQQTPPMAEEKPAGEPNSPSASIEEMAGYSSSQQNLVQPPRPHDYSNGLTSYHSPRRVPVPAPAAPPPSAYPVEMSRSSQGTYPNMSRTAQDPVYMKGRAF